MDFVCDERKEVAAMHFNSRSPRLTAGRPVEHTILRHKRHNASRSCRFHASEQACKVSMLTTAEDISVIKGFA